MHKPVTLIVLLFAFANVVAPSMATAHVAFSADLHQAGTLSHCNSCALPADETALMTKYKPCSKKTASKMAMSFCQTLPMVVPVVDRLYADWGSGTFVVISQPFILSAIHAAPYRPPRALDL